MKPLESILLVRKVIKRKRSKKAMESIERLFRESFTPAYELQQRNEANQELADFIKSVERDYRLVAIKSMASILAKTDENCSYHN